MAMNRRNMEANSADRLHCDRRQPASLGFGAPQIRHCAREPTELFRRLAVAHPVAFLGLSLTLACSAIRLRRAQALN